MNGKDILKSLSDIDPQFIDEAERSAQENSKHKFKLFLAPKKVYCFNSRRSDYLFRNASRLGCQKSGFK